METKENVCVEQGAEEIMKEKGECPADASTALGKFKDVDALKKAYESLQAEFTRRSQRLKELEKTVENWKTQSGEQKSDLGAEKLRKNACLRREREKEFNRFVADLEQGNGSAENSPPLCEEQPVRLSDTPVNSVPNADTATAETQGIGGNTDAVEKEKAVPSVATTGCETAPALSTEELYLKATADESVRLKIIGEYLQSLGKAGAPLIRGGAGVIVSPPVKAKSICQAGDMALRFFQKTNA